MATKKTKKKVVKKKPAAKKPIPKKKKAVTKPKSKAKKTGLLVHPGPLPACSENGIMGVSTPVQSKPAFRLPPRPVAAAPVTQESTQMETQTMPKFQLPVSRPAFAPAPPTFQSKPAAPKPTAVAAPKAAAPKKTRGPSKKDYFGKSYHQLRKWTVVKLEELLSADSVAVIRAKIGSKFSGVLRADELLAYCKQVENEEPTWKSPPPLPNGEKRKRGRPSKADLAARAAAITPQPNPAPFKPAPAKFGGFAPNSVSKPTFRVPGASN